MKASSKATMSLLLLGLIMGGLSLGSAFSPHPTPKQPAASFVSRKSRGGVVPIHYVNGDADGTTLLEKEVVEKPPITTSTSRRPFRRPVHTNVCSRTGVPLSRYMMEMEKLNPELSEVESIFTSIQVACKAISKLVKTASLEGHTGLHDGGTNTHGEEQKTLDVMANDVLKKAFQWSGHMHTLMSEEEEAPVLFAEDVDGQEGTYIACFDPLDGSSNIDCGLPVGTIFGIFHADHDALQPGNNLVAAGYCLYSSATTLVFTLGDGVHGFTLDEGLGEFVLTHPNMKMPDRGKIYSMNEGNRLDWDEPLQKYVHTLQQGSGEGQTKYSGRYCGSMVADIHRTLQYGGIFAYPGDKKNPDGKLRLMYEAAPMSMIIENAGGLSTTGTERIMDIEPYDVHQKVPCILGSRDDVNELLSYYA
jgi:fructose-1,6-bisphosphatase I